MPDAPKNVYEVQRSGFWSSRHEFRENGDALGVLELDRNVLGLVRKGTYRPVKGALLTMERDHGLRRGQFTVWSEGREWIASSERNGFFERVLKLHAGGKPFHLVPLRGFEQGFGIHAPRTGEAARILSPVFAGRTKIEVWKRLDFPLVLFAYFLGVQIRPEALWPGPEVHPGSL